MRRCERHLKDRTNIWQLPNFSFYFSKAARWGGTRSTFHSFSRPSWISAPRARRGRGGEEDLAGEPKGKGQKILGSPATTVSHLHFQVNKSIPRDVKVWPANRLSISFSIFIHQKIIIRKIWRLKREVLFFLGLLITFNLISFNHVRSPKEEIITISTSSSCRSKERK